MDLYIGDTEVGIAFLNILQLLTKQYFFSLLKIK
jgi:hypothetical protein